MVRVVFFHGFSFLCALAFVGGVVYLAAALPWLERVLPGAIGPTAPKSPSESTVPSDPTGSNGSGRTLCRSDGARPRALRRWLGTGCAVASFLLLPTGSFPAYIPCEAAFPVWLALFAIACAALGMSAVKATFATPPQGPVTRAATPPDWAALSAPLVLALIVAVCARYAWLRGFPGNVWSMEVYVALPLYTRAGLAHSVGLGCLTTAAVLHGLALRDTVSVGSDTTAPSFTLLRACVRLAAAQFTVCLFFPILPSRLWALPAGPGFIADYILHWGLVLGLCLISPLTRHVVRPQYIWPIVRSAVPVLLTLGAGLCLL